MLKSLVVLQILLAAPAFAAVTSQLQMPPSPNPEALKSISLSFEVPSLEFELTDKKSGQDSEFKPNEAINAGVAVNYEGYNLGLVLPVPPPAEDTRRKGTTHNFDIYLGHYWKQFGGDVFYQRYQGFYMGSDASDEDDTSAYPQRPDVKSHFYGANFYYAFSPDRFPLDSLTHFNVQAGHRGGSIIALASLNEFYMAGARALISSNTLTAARLRTFTLGGGYAYRWTFGKHQALKGDVLVGAGPQDQLLERASGHIDSHVRLGEQVTVNGNYSYQLESWLFGLDLKANSVESDLGDNETLSSDGFSGTLFAARQF